MRSCATSAAFAAATEEAIEAVCGRVGVSEQPAGAGFEVDGHRLVGKKLV
jgi:hypothetical protein